MKGHAWQFLDKTTYNFGRTLGSDEKRMEDTPNTNNILCLFFYFTSLLN